MTLADMRAMATEYLGLKALAATGSYLNLSSLDRALNLGLIEVYRECKCASRVVTIAGVDDQAVYALPVDMFDPYRVTYDGTLLTPTDALLLARDVTADWQATAAGTPTHWLRWGAQGIRMYPAPENGTGDNLTVEGHISPSDITPVSGETVPLLVNATDTPLLPYAFQTLPVLYAVSYVAAHQLADDPRATQSGQMALREYATLLRDFKGSLVNVAAFR